MATSYVVTDRTTAAAVAIKIDDGQVYIETGASSPQSEPIVLDDGDGATHWKIFVDDGQIGVESTATVQDDEVFIVDGVSAASWKLLVVDGTFAIAEESAPASSGGAPAPILLKRRRR